MKSPQKTSAPALLDSLEISLAHLRSFITSSSSFEDTILSESLDEIDTHIQRKLSSFNSDLASRLGLDDQ